MDWLIEALLKMAKLDAGTVSMKKKTVNDVGFTEKVGAGFLDSDGVKRAESGY